MYSRKNLCILLFLFLTSYLYAQTNVGGVINSDSIWTLSKSPYSVTSTLTIRDGAILTIENGVEVKFPGSSGINIGSSSTSSGNIFAVGVKFTSLYSSDSRINIRYELSSGSFHACTFDNVYLYIDNAQVTFNFTVFYNCNYPISINDEGKISGMFLFSPDNIHKGIERTGTISHDFRLDNYRVPYYIDGLTVRDGATLTIKDSTEVYFPSSNGIYVGSSSTSIGHLFANDVQFIGLGSSDAQIAFRANSTGSITACTIKNAYLNIDNASPEIKNCKISKCVNAIYTRNNAAPSIQNNDFFNNTTAIKNIGTNTVIAANNFWGHFTGPQHSNNPTGLGQEIEGNVDYQPFFQNPVNGSIQHQFTVNVIEVAETRVGSYKDTEVKFLTSIGDVDLLITNIESDSDTFIVKSIKYFWVTNGDTAVIKIRFTPTSSTEFLGNLNLFTNQQTNSPISISVKGKGTSYLSLSSDTLNFGTVDLKDYKTVNLTLRNEGTTSIHVDSIVSTNPNFNYVLGSYPLEINENLYPDGFSSLNKDGTNINSLSGFYISPHDSEKILVTFKPRNMNVETGYLKIYYKGYGVETIFLMGEGYSAPVAVRISSINFQNFPFIYLSALVDTFGTAIETLAKSNYQIFENGVLQNLHFNVTQPGEGTGSRLADIVFIMDNSGSLQNERDAVAQNVNNFVNSLSTSGIDYAFGLCRYGSANQGGAPIIEDNGILTSDVEYFKSSVWTRNQTGGGTEPGYLAIKQSASDFTFRPGSQKIFIIITDEVPTQGGGNLNDALSICMNNSITLFALTISNLYKYFTPITEATHGSVYDITSNFNDILTYISTSVSSSYLLEYSSTSPEYDNVFREVVVRVEYQGNSNTDTVYYNPLALPRIQRTSETQKYHEKSWTEGTAFKIQVLIKDEYEPFVKYARLYFRETGALSYTFLPMSFDGNDLYSATIPGTYSEPPGVDYYITASDSISTTSDPKNSPALMPYQIAILPNVAPVITHTPVGFAQLNTAVQIDATIEDITNSISSAVLYYKKPGQLSYQSTPMNSLGSNNYSASIPGIWNTRDGLEYYIRVTDDFNLSNYHGTYDSPHKIAVAATVLNAQIDTLSIGPSIQNVIVPSNGAGYCYFNFNYLNNPYYSNSTITIKLWVQNDLFETEGIFIKPGLLRIKIPSVIVLDSSVIFTLANQISFNDSLFNINGSSFQIKATKIPAEFKRSWDVFASGSAGVSGTVGSIGAGASAAAAKLSVKGTAGGGLTISKDQDNKLSLDRRLEASVAVGLEVPSLNAVGAKATVGTGTITVKALLGQEFCFSDINLSENKKQMAQAGFLLETFSIAGVGLSPIVGPILKAVIDVLNSAGGVNSTFEQAHISDYWGTGLEGSIGAGFQIKAQAVNLNALNSTASIALNLKFIDYFRKSGKRFKKLSSLTDYVGHSIELSQAIGFSFSTLDFGLKANDKVELQGGNLSLFDAGLGTEISATADFTSSFDFDGLTVTLTGGGGLTMFGTTKDKYYSTEIEFPKEYGQVFTSVGSSLAGFFSSTKTIPLGSDLVNVTVQSLKDAYNNIKPIPIKITTLEKRGKGFSLDFSIDLDAALLLGVGVSLGVTAKYYDEVEFPKKVSNVYLNGNNFLLYTSNYNSDMESDHFTDVVKDLLSGTLPLIKEAFSNILETLTEIVVAGKKFVISVVTSTGDAVGEVVGEAKEAGKWVVTQFSSWLPMSYQKHQFEKPIFKKMYYSTRVMHPDNTGVRKLAMVDSKLILVSETMVVNFYKTGSTSSEKSVEDPYQIKMIIKDNTLLENYFTTDDKDKVKLYYYDDELLNWVLVGGTRSADTLTASVNMLGSFALGIEINSMKDSKAPSILEYGPTSGSIQTNYPEIYMIVKDDEYGSGLDLSRSFIILNGDTLNYSFDPAESKIYYQLSRGDSLKTSTMYVQIICTDLAGNISSTNFEFNLDLTWVNKEKDIPDKFALYQNYPNPFNPSTTIRFDIPQKTSVEINIYDIRGSFVVTLFSGKLDPGHHSIIWKGVNNYGSQVASGIYFYQIKTEEFNAVRKMQVIK